MTAMSQPLPDGLPVGRFMIPDPEWNDGTTFTGPQSWVSDEYVPDISAQWRRLLGQHAKTGWWPLLLTGPAIPPHLFARLTDELRRKRAGQPWHTGQIQPASAEGIDDLDPEAILSRWWRGIFRGGSDEFDFGEDSLPRPPLPGWPGLAAAEPIRDDPDRVALEVVGSPDGIREMIGGRRTPYLGLVPAADGAAAIPVCGWDPRGGDPTETGAVVRSWQRRFGARLCALGSKSFAVTVAAPPRTTAQAVKVTAEHLALLGDLGHDFDTYAAALIDDHVWSFWWD